MVGFIPKQVVSQIGFLIPLIKKNISMKNFKLLLLPVLLFTCFLAKAQTANSQISVQNKIQHLIEEHAGDYAADYLEWNPFQAKMEAGLKTLTWLRDSSYYHDLDNGAWFLDGRYKVLTRNDYGNTLTGIREFVESGVYSNRYYYEWTYYDANTRKDYTLSAWNSDTEEWTEIYLSLIHI